MPARISEMMIGDLLAMRRFEVPDFQRPFSWTGEELTALMGDLTPCLTPNAQRLFLGAMVFETGTSGRNIVWDGQQRLGALLMVIAAARDWGLSRADPTGQQEARNINTRFLEPDRYSPGAPDTLTLGDLDRGTFQKYVLLPLGDPNRGDQATWDSVPVQEKRRRWSRRVAEGYFKVRELMATYLDNSLASHANTGACLQAFVTNLLRGGTVIAVQTETEEEAFRTFEVLNDRGLELSSADLIKNYLLSRFNPGTPARADVKALWDDMVRTIGSDRLTTFIRHYYMSRYGRCTRGELYRKFVTIFGAGPSAPTPRQFLDDLNDAAELYSKLLDPVAAGWTLDGLKDSLQSLSRIGAVQWTPLLLAAQAVQLGEPEYERLTKTILCLFIRRIVVGGANPNALEPIFAEASKKMFESVVGPGPTVAVDVALNEAIATVRTEIPNDDLFRQSFLALAESSRASRFLLLESLEKQLQLDVSGGAVPFPPVLDVEHIYPVKPGRGWPAAPRPGGRNPRGYVEPDDRERIGNLTLLHYKPNRGQKNAPFATKVGNYRTSQLLITNRVAGVRSWNLRAIDARQAELAELAIRTWPLP
jgi:hypothetical protein